MDLLQTRHKLLLRWSHVEYCDVFHQLFWRHPFTAEAPLMSKSGNFNFFPNLFLMKRLIYILVGRRVSTFSVSLVGKWLKLVKFRAWPQLSKFKLLTGKLFVVGGFDGSHALRCVEVYDPAKNEWRMLGSMTSARSNAGLAVLNDVLCAVGGFDGNDFLNTMEAYDPEKQRVEPVYRGIN